MIVGMALFLSVLLRAAGAIGAIGGPIVALVNHEPGLAVGLFILGVILFGLGWKVGEWANDQA
jgi:hypothetical protein